MKLLEIILIAVGLAMDAFAVSVCKGLSMKKINYKKVFIIALYFGLFQTFMPVIGYFLGISFQSIILNIDHWIAFGLLCAIGGKMVLDSFEDESDEINDSIEAKTMIILAIATSIDALAVGITFAFLSAKLLSSVLIIGIITFILAIVGVKLGNKFGGVFENKAEIIGGGILIIMGFKILLEHTGVI